MNVLIIEEHQWLKENVAITNARQSQHIHNILKLKIGDTLSVGSLNGMLGRGTIMARQQDNYVIGDIQLNQAPPPVLPINLILAMPRPQMLKRILQTVATMGVKHLCFLQTSRVEKSFWQSPSATPKAIHEQLIIGLEQGIATQLPHVSLFKRFRPFVEDELANLSLDNFKYIADPSGTGTTCQHSLSKNITLAIGPEGGFLEKEVDYFMEAGFTAIHLGKRILKVETAVPVLLAKLYEC